MGGSGGGEGNGHFCTAAFKIELVVLHSVTFGHCGNGDLVVSFRHYFGSDAVGIGQHRNTKICAKLNHNAGHGVSFGVYNRNGVGNFAVVLTFGVLSDVFGGVAGAFGVGGIVARI